MINIDLGQLAAGYGATNQPQSSFDCVADIFIKRFDPRLMTFFAWGQGDDLCERVWSNNPEKYPVPFGKKMGPTKWGQTVLREQTPWFGKDEAAMEDAFPDHKLIKSVGCSSCLSAPVVANGQSVGAVSILHAQGTYTASDLHDVTQLTALLVAPLLLRKLG
ncbi:GAF domain-containing protein [Thalassospira lucentensis]|uniref:GAF domain-containing protein n=1 Tax=Thalassospira lucentensis TaxID=168935 RepID=UPI00142D307F|nr:GAF domain-containing protein [Thalassospira lucentensis]NIZ01739.1 GAF domain-containing protein [Thalassospira lucentensis]